MPQVDTVCKILYNQKSAFAGLCFFCKTVGNFFLGFTLFSVLDPEISVMPCFIFLWLNIGCKRNLCYLESSVFSWQHWIMALWNWKKFWSNYKQMPNYGWLLLLLQIHIKLMCKKAHSFMLNTWDWGGKRNLFLKWK